MLQTQSQPVRDDSCESDRGEEVGGELVIACRDAAEVLEPAEGILDEMALLVAGSVVANGRCPRAAARDDRNRSSFTDRIAQSVGIVALIGNDVACADGALEKRWSGTHVGDVSRRERDRVGAPDVGERVDLGGLPNNKKKNRLRPPPFSTERGALGLDVDLVDRRAFFNNIAGGERLEQSVPETS